MMTTSAALNTKAWHRSILIYFFVFGLAPAALMVRLPLVRTLLGVTNSQLGLLLLCMSIGAIISVTQSGRFIARFGTRASIIMGCTGVALGLLGTAVAIVNHSPVGYGIFAFLTGLGMGFADVGINVDGAAIETATGKTALPKMHAAFSIGTFAGAGVGTLASHFEFNLLAQMAILVAITMSIPFITTRFLPATTGIEPKKSKDASANEPKVAIWKSRGIIFLSIGILGMTLAEGASNDWLTIALVDDFDQTATMAGIGFAILLAAMTLTRFFGGNLADRFGKTRTLQTAALTGVVGLLMIILLHNVFLAFIGAALWGCGVALGFPLFLSVAGEGENSARRVSFVASSGYIAFLVGPPLLGFLGQTWGVTNMFYVVAGFLV
ncbi:MAG: MFS transporter, partial [Rhodoluna sp.]